MTRVFIDSSVFFSAAYSSRGHSRDLILMALGGEVDLVLSRLVLEETRRALTETAPRSLFFLEFVLESVPYEIVRPSKRQVLKAAEYTAFKDAPIAAAAKMAKVELLVTLDRKHLLGRPDLARHIGADIVTPREVMERLGRTTETLPSQPVQISLHGCIGFSIIRCFGFSVTELKHQFPYISDVF